ncbi:ionotropic receptor 75a-like [Prorops nasuta]|uniref:ionotropic receptor 75a-like n=1 Tax=Prorops nasuta TaxID=863751 RepID=UPI0034CE72AA
MKLKYLIFLLQLLWFTSTLANEFRFIREYFSHKNVPSVVGISCGDINSDIKFFREFSQTLKYLALSNLESSAPLLNFDKFLFTNYSQLGVIVDLRCDNNNSSYTIFSKAAEKYLYGKMHKWLIMDTDLENSVKYLYDNTFNLDTDLMIAINELNDDHYKIYDIYNPCKLCGGALNITFAGTWSTSDGLQIFLNQTNKFSRRRNLNGIKIKIGVSVSIIKFKKNRNDESESLESYLLVNSGSNTIDNAAKFMYAVFVHIAEYVNFTIELVEAKASNYGQLKLPREPFKANIDLFFHPAIITTEALNYADIVIPIWPVRTCYIFRTTSSSRIKLLHFLQPLSAKSWFVLLMLLIFANILLLAALKVEGIFHLRDRVETRKICCKENNKLLVGAEFLPNKSSGRVAYLHIMILALLLYNFYSALIVAERLDPFEKKMNDSLVSLANSNLHIAMEPTKYIEWLIKQPQYDVNYFYFNKIHKIPLEDLYFSVEVGLRKLARDKLAYHSSTDTAYPYIEKTFTNQEICELTKVHVLNTMVPIWSKKNGHFIEILRVSFTKTLETGLHRRLLKYWTARSPHCYKTLFAYPLSIQEAAPILMLFLLGIFISLFIFVTEQISFRLERKV